MDVKQALKTIEAAGADDSRKTPFLLIWPVLTPVSQRTLTALQEVWEPEGKSFGDSCAIQNAELRKCLVMEISELGAIVRQSLGYEPLMWDTEIGAVEPTMSNET